MTGPLGLGDGNMQAYRAIAEDKAADARRPRPGRVDEGRWPSALTVVRMLGLVVLTIIVFGWILTLIRA